MTAGIAVVVPTRGDERALSNIASNIARSLSPGSLHVILNQASPPAPEIWSRIKNHCPDARFHLCPGGGVSRARNLALRVVKADTVVFVDDDVVLPEGAVENMVAALKRSKGGVATARIVPAPSQRDVAVLYREFLGLDRGPENRTFTHEDLDHMTPMTVWELGVGAAFAVRSSILNANAQPPVFDETLSNGRFCGGTEDVDFFFQCLLADIPVIYCGEVMITHEFPTALQAVAAKMRQYGRADGAFYAKWGDRISRRQVFEDLTYWAERFRLHVRLAFSRKDHVPLLPLLCEPFDKLLGAVWWRRVAGR